MKKLLVGLGAYAFTAAMLALLVFGMGKILYAGTAFFKYETRCAGMYKTCVYDYLGSDYVISKSCVSLCPITIQVN